LEGKKCFKCPGFGHFQADCPNRKTLTIREVKEIQALEDESSEEEDENDVPTLVTADVGELLLIKRSLYVTKTPIESQGEKMFNSRFTIGRKVYGLIIDGGSCINVASNTLINKLQIATKEHPT